MTNCDNINTCFERFRWSAMSAMSKKEPIFVEKILYVDEKPKWRTIHCAGFSRYIPSINQSVRSKIANHTKWWINQSLSGKSYWISKCLSLVWFEELKSIITSQFQLSSSYYSSGYSTRYPESFGRSKFQNLIRRYIALLPEIYHFGLTDCRIRFWTLICHSIKKKKELVLVISLTKLTRNGKYC